MTHGVCWLACLPSLLFLPCPFFPRPRSLLPIASTPLLSLPLTPSFLRSRQRPPPISSLDPPPSPSLSGPLLLLPSPKVFPADYPDQSPLCSLASHAVHVLAASAMEHFEARGLPDPSASTEPLVALMAHPFVEMGGAMVGWVGKEWGPENGGVVGA